MLIRASLPLALLALASPLASRQLDQVSPSTNAWFYTASGNVWQQQVRAGVGGQLEAFELTVEGPAGSQVELRLRVGDGWNVGPVAWSTLFAKPTAAQERPRFDVRSAGIQLVPGDTFVLEIEGDGSGIELVGSYLHPQLGPPGYAEALFLDGPGTYLNGGWRVGFRTWMSSAPWSGPGRLGLPSEPLAVLPGVHGLPTLGVLWIPGVLHRAPRRAAGRAPARARRASTVQPGLAIGRSLAAKASRALSRRSTSALPL